MPTFITIIHIATCILLVLVVMIQSGKGAEISASFGGSSQTVFGSSGGANFFVKFTGAAAAVFMITSLTLTVLGGRSNRSVFEGVAVPAGKTVPLGKGAIPGTTAPAPIKPANPAGLPGQPTTPAGNENGAATQNAAPAQTTR